ncbi:hypothetical protein GQ53DRAFT_827466 [Thozetella sp. PMI_491]|nr:hypothetical protein GQ53DRAFT_827466 [Thozetella sp. PMI_491]
MAVTLLKTVALIAALCADAVRGDAPQSMPRITSVSYSGNGCPDNLDNSGDFNNPTFTFRHFVASSPGVNQTVNCEIHLQSAGGSAGWQVSLSEVDVRGHVVLDPGMRLNYYVQTYFSENAGNTVTARERVGGDGQALDYPVQIRQGLRELWSPCTGGNGAPGILNVNFRVSLMGDGHGYFEGTSETWNFNWRRC